MSAEELRARADQKLKGGFFRCFAGTQRFDEALEIYQQAATQFKISKQWSEAAECELQCAYCAEKTGSPDEASHYEKAGSLCEKFSSQKAQQHYEKATCIYKEKGQWKMAGKLYKQLAAMYESTAADYEETIQFYQLAADMYELDDYSRSDRSTCMLKIAEYAAKSGNREDVQKSIKIFEGEGEAALKNNVTQYGAKEHFFRASILHLASGDSVTIRIALDKYSCLDPRFGDSREGNLMQNLAQALETHDVELFEDKVQEFDSMTKLDPWKIDFLLKAKSFLQSSGLDALESADGVDLT